MNKPPINWIKRSEKEPTHKEGRPILISTYYGGSIWGGWEANIASWNEGEQDFIEVISGSSIGDDKDFIRWTYINYPTLSKLEIDILEKEALKEAESVLEINYLVDGGYSYEPLHNDDRVRLIIDKTFYISPADLLDRERSSKNNKDYLKSLGYN